MSQIQQQPYIPNVNTPLGAEDLLNRAAGQILSSGTVLPPDKEEALLAFSNELPELPKPKEFAAGSSIALDLLLDLIGEKSRETEVKAGLSSIQANAKVREAKNQEKIAKIEEQIKKLEDAGFWDKVGSVFKYIGMAVAAVACVAMIATGVGSGVGVAGLVLLSVSPADQILDAVGEAVCGEGWGLTSGIAKLAEVLGASEDVKMYLKMALDLAISVAALACTFGAGSASSAGSFQKIVEAVSKGATIAQGVTGVAGSAATIVSASYTYDAEVARADQKRLQAILEQINLINELTNEHLKAVIEQSQKVNETVTDIVNENADTQTAILTEGGGVAMA